MAGMCGEALGYLHLAPRPTPEPLLCLGKGARDGSDRSEGEISKVEVGAGVWNCTLLRVNSYGRCTGVRNLLVRCVYVVVEAEW